jgi:uncharacterized membrane protein YkvA (DUF1232 family)
MTPPELFSSTEVILPERVKDSPLGSCAKAEIETKEVIKKIIIHLIVFIFSPINLIPNFFGGSL